MILALDFGSRCFRPVQVVRARYQRWRGLRSVSTTGLLLYGRSVHSFGLRLPLSVVFLDGDGCVLKATRMSPGRVASHRRARLVLEAPADWGLPKVGERGVAYAHSDGRPTDSLCNPDRQPG